jgi:hypothetical protein
MSMYASCWVLKYHHFIQSCTWYLSKKIPFSIYFYRQALLILLFTFCWKCFYYTNMLYYVTWPKLQIFIFYIVGCKNVHLGQTLQNNLQTLTRPWWLRGLIEAKYRFVSLRSECTDTRVRSLNPGASKMEASAQMANTNIHIRIPSGSVCVHMMDELFELLLFGWFIRVCMYMDGGHKCFLIAIWKYWLQERESL